MRRMRFLAGLGAAALAVPLGAQTRTTTLDAVSLPQPIDTVTQAQDVRFKDDGHDRMTVAVRLSGSGPYRFLVDTGADRTAVSSELAKRLGLTAGPNALLHSVTGVSTVATAQLPRLQLSHAEMKIADAPLLSDLNIGADGILGVDSLRAQRVLFNFKARTMTIVPAAHKVIPHEEGTIVVRAREKNGRLVLTSANADGARLSVVLDTGSEVSIGNSALRRRLMAGNVLQRSGKVSLQSVTGEQLTGEYMVLEKLEIGGVLLENLAIVFADAHTFKKLGLDKRPALLLGMNAMRAFDKVTIDFANKKLRVTLPEHGSLEQAQFAQR
ncbi:aspartyl protease family protein [Sphingomonas sp.]|uniref:aspartyl protease family protein n=1 Tax=Sphingomonas sp. TaxID=28214 RepID=UPI00286D7A29|nr:aspartyl protease family protein [Sphingomonas sp.]